MKTHVRDTCSGIARAAASLTILLGLAALSQFSCAGVDDCVVGTEGCRCTSTSACDPGLTCAADGSEESICLAPGAGGGRSGQAGISHKDAFVGLYSGSYVTDSGNYFNAHLVFDGRDRLIDGEPVWRADGSFDFEASTTKERVRTGTFRVEGDRMLVVFDRDGKQASYAVSRSPRGDLKVRMDGTDYLPTYPSTVTQLQGLFVAKTISSYGTAGGTYGSSSSVKRFMFTADGQFMYDREGAVTGSTAVGGMQVSGGSATSSSSGAGGYRVRGLFMTLTFTDGTTMEDLFEPETPGSDPNAGFFWGTNYYFKR
jgi:hypothetical protein